jgi:pantoate--beta-alanine ligase
MQMYKIDRFGSKIILYAPTVEDIYEGKPTSQSLILMVLKTGRQIQTRPFWRGWHYCKAPFEIVAPTNAYFGEKDFQQLQIVKCCQK